LHFTRATHCPNKATSLVLVAKPAKNYKTRLTANAERTRGNCIAVDVAAAEGRKCRDLLAESPNNGSTKTQTTPHVQILN